MIIGVDELLSMPEFDGANPAALVRKLKGVESLIRSYTNNNFQNRAKRFTAAAAGGVLCGVDAAIKAGDTVQITESINEGIYVVTDISKNCTTLDALLMDEAHNLITKVEYPAAVVDGVTNLLLWDVKNRAKVGVKSETLSRHSVTYYDQDASNQLMGYPVSLLGFLKPFVKARF